MRRYKAVIWTIILSTIVIMSLASGIWASTPDRMSGPGTTRNALTLQDGEHVTLDEVMVWYVIAPYIFVRDPWIDSPVIPVYANVAIDKAYTVDVSGTMASILGQRIIIADQISLYTDASGRAIPPILKGPNGPYPWVHKSNIVVTAPANGSIPPPSYPNPLSQPIEATRGSVAEAKLRDLNANAVALSSNSPQIDGGSVDLSGKVVTAVFYQPETQVVSSFYIQEPVTGGNGIKVVPTQSSAVVLGDIVHVVGTVVASSSTVAECYIQATTVTPSGYKLFMGPAGVTQRNTISKDYGNQGGLYGDCTLTTPVKGNNLSLVGTRVRVWGRVTWQSEDGLVYYIDDGSALKSRWGNEIRTGIRVVRGPSSPSIHITQVGNIQIADVTGVLGVELDQPTGGQGLPVPVVRVSEASQGGVIKVKFDSDGPSFDGKTWQTAYHSIQQAINAAASGDEIWVAAGTYEENITLSSGVRLYGSFAGTECTRQTNRSRLANETVIQGDGTDSVVYIGSVATSSTVLDGFTIRGGLGHYTDEWYGPYGGGIFCDNASPVISHNLITSNGDTSYTYGGGIACYGGSPSLCGNTISGNQASSGGGIYLDSTTSATVKNNIIDSNSASAGGGVYATDASGRLSGNVIAHNTATYYNGGGIYCMDYLSTLAPEITNNTIAYNNSPSYGGGVFCDSCSPIIVNNIVSANSSGQLAISGLSNPNIHTNCISGDTPYSGWTTNPSQDILSDPLLVGFHIQTGSPCLNEGDNTVIQFGDTDIDGQPRILPAEGVVDIGADEWNELDAGLPSSIICDELTFFSSLVSYSNY
ncbi:MAG: DUF1565 domain-containing protein [Armatimonadetes bacterium]|nr:DUF1565 domain-containing protein [Armatimonadota bacterium]